MRTYGIEFYDIEKKEAKMLNFIIFKEVILIFC